MNTFYSNSSTLVGNFFLSASPLVYGDFEIFLIVSGPSSDQYYHNTSIPVKILNSMTPNPPPLLSTAQFSNDGGSVLVYFSAPTNKANILTVFFACSLVFEFYGDILSTCSWVSSTIVKINLGINKLLSVSDFITVKSNIVKASCTDLCDMYGLAQSQTVIISAPINPVVPNIIVAVPPSLSSCDDVIIDSSSTTGFGGRPLIDVQWTVSKTIAGVTYPDDDILYELESHSNNILKEIIISKTLFTEATYTLSLSITNFLGQSSSSTAIFTIAVNPNLPIVQILGPSVISISPIQQLSLQSTISRSSCAYTDSAVTYYWEVFKFGSSQALGIKSISVNPTMFTLSSYSLEAGNVYTFKFHATAGMSKESKYSAISSSTSVEVHVYHGNIIASIVGGSSRLISWSQPFSLDASLSYDEDSGTSSMLDFRWSCAHKSVLYYGQSCDSLFGSLSRNRDILSLDLNSGSNFAYDTVYSFQVQVTDIATGRFAITVVDIQVLDVRGSTTVTKIMNTVLRSNANSKLIIDGSVQASYDVFCQRSAYASDGQSIVLNSNTPKSQVFPLVSLSSTSDFPLSVAANSFIPGSTITFRLTAYKADNPLFQSYAETVIVINAPPSGGILSCSPLVNGVCKGEALKTIFTVTTTSWTDDASDFPLSYKFVYSLDPTLSPLIVQSQSSSNKVSTDLPADLEAQTYQISMFVIVYDQSSASANATILITVHAVKLNSTALNDYFNEKIRLSESSGNPDFISQCIANIANTINAVNCSAASTSYCASLNRKPCLATPQTCSECLDGFVGLLGDANFICSNKRRLSVQLGNACKADEDCSLGYCSGEVCSAPALLCPSVVPQSICSGHGSCQYKDSSGRTLNRICTIHDPDCSRQCICYEGYGGSSCSLTYDELIVNDLTRFKLCDLIMKVKRSTDNSSQLLESL